MGKFIVTIDTDTDAFYDYALPGEVQRCLERAGVKFNDAWDDAHGLKSLTGRVRDINGNTVGEWSYTE